MHNLFSPIPKLPWWDQNGIRTGIVGIGHTGKKEATYLKTQHTKKISNAPTTSPSQHTHTTHPPIESTRSLGQGKRFSFFLWDRRRRKVRSSKDSSKMTVMTRNCLASDSLVLT